MDRWMRIVDYDDDINHCALKVTRERTWKNEEDEKLCEIGQPIDKHAMMRKRKEKKKKETKERKRKEDGEDEQKLKRRMLDVLTALTQAD